MKKTIAIISTLLFIPAAFCQNEPDTLLNIKDPSKLVITEERDGTFFNVVSGDDDDYIDETIVAEHSGDYSVSSRHYKFQNIMQDGYVIGGKGSGGHWSAIVDGICIGLNNSSGQPAPDAMQWSKSFELSWMSFFGIAYNYKASSISLGIGFDWRNYRTTLSDIRLIKNEAGGIDWMDYEKGERGRMSRLKTFGLQFPLLYRVKFPKSSLQIAFGPVLNVTTYASIKSVFDDADGNKCEEFTKGLGIKKTTVDLFGSISFARAIGIYVRYSPEKVMKAPGLNFRRLSVGLTLGI